MATTNLGPDSAGVIHTGHFPPAAAARIAASLLNRHSPHEIAEAIEVLVDVLDLVGGDSDAEDATGLEDAFEDHGERSNYEGPGCPVSDAGGGNVEDEGEAIDEREPDHDAEIETWAHPDDHPAELHIGTRPGWNDGPEAA